MELFTNTKKLKIEMLRYGDTIKDLANVLGLTVSTLSKRINNKSDWYCNEINIIKDRYSLDDNRTIEIFWAGI